MSSLKQANEIASYELFTREYRVKIPAKDVEIDGVVTEGSLTVDDILRHGVGCFKNPLIQKDTGCQAIAFSIHRRREEEILPFGFLPCSIRRIRTAELHLFGQGSSACTPVRTAGHALPKLQAVRSYSHLLLQQGPLQQVRRQSC